MDGQVRIERHGELGVLVVDRPPVNAIDLPLARRVPAVLRETGSEYKAIVVASALPCFCAGVDLRVVPTYGPEQQDQMRAAIDELVTTLYGWPAPVVAAVSGHALGGGLVVALCADFRVGTTAPCKLGMPEVRAGIPFPAAAMAVVRAELTAPVVRRLVLHGAILDGAAALACGVLDEIAPPERVRARALEIAAELAALPATTYRKVKRDLRTGYAHDEAWLAPETAASSAGILRR